MVAGCSGPGDRPLKRFFAFFLLLCGLALAALVVAPSFIDWNAYRGELAALLSRMAGREVSIDGNLELAILPSPYLNARDIRIANIAGAAEANLAQVREIRMQVAIGPLFTGRIAVNSLLLVEPEINLEIMPDGRANWDLAAGRAAKPSGPGGKPALPLQFSFDRVAIANGSLAWRTADGRTRRLEKLNTQITMADLAGPVRLQASTNYKGRPLTVDLSIGKRSHAGSVPIRALLSLAGGAGEISLSGALDRRSQAMEGKLGIKGPDAAAFAAAIAGRPVGGLPAWEFALQSPVKVTAEAIEADEVSIRLGKLNATGWASLGLGDVPFLKASLDVASLNIDEMVAEASEPAASAAKSGAGVPGPAAIPETFDAEIQLAARILRWKGGIVRDAGLAAKLEDGVLTIGRASAQLPGGTTVTLSGKAVNDTQGARLDGDLAVISDNLRAALVWGGVDEAALPPDRLRAFSYTSRIAILPEAVNLTEVNARFDATRVSGAAVIARRERPSFGLRVELDRIDLDAYLTGHGDDGQAGEGKGETAQQGTAGLAAFDANIDLSIANLSWRDKPMSALRVDAQLFDGELTLRKLTVGNLGGAVLEISGVIGGLAGDPRAELDLTLDGGNPESFAAFIGMGNSILARRIGRFRVGGRAVGNLDRTEIDAVLDALGGTVKATGAITGLDGRFAYDLAMLVSHADSGRVLALAMPDRRDGGAGALEARFQMSGGADAMAFGNLSGRLGKTEFSGFVEVGLRGERPDIVADLATGVVMLDKLFPARPAPAAGAHPVRGSARWSREPIDVAGLRDFDLRLAIRSEALVGRGVRMSRARLRARVKDGVAVVEELSGDLFGGSMKATGRLDATAAAPVIEGAIAARDVSSRAALEAISDFARFEGPVSLDLSLRAVGRNEFELISSLAGSGAVSGNVEARLKADERTQAGVGVLLGVILGDRIREVGAAGDAMGTLIRAFAVEPAELSGDLIIRRGVARTENLQLDGADAQALTIGSADLANWTVDSTTALRRRQDKEEPYITLGLKGPLDEPNIRTGGTWLKKSPESSPQTPVAAPGPEADKPLKPEDFILDILKSIQ